MTDSGADRHDAVRAAFREAIAATVATVDKGVDALVRAADVMSRALAAGGKVLVFGNGGSAAEAQHFAAELVGRFERERQALCAIALTTDTSILTAIGNDYAYDQVFARQVAALGRPGDVAVGISTSGRSGNVLEGLRCARSRQMTTVGLTGGNGGPMGEVVDVHINVPHDRTARIQEVQLMQLHIICSLVEQALAGDSEGPMANGQLRADS